MVCEIIYHILSIIINLIVRRQIINYIGIEVVALNHVLNQIVNFIAVIEFGIYNIMVFNLYGALKEKNENKINEIMNIFKHIYTYVAGLIILIGICFLPLVKYFINDYNSSINYTIIYILILIQISVTFLFSYKTYLLQADQKSYLYLIIMTIFKVISSIIEILLLICFKNYYIYFIVFVIDNLLMYYIISKYVSKKYQFLDNKKINIDTNYYSEIKKHIKSTAISKVCSVLKQSLDIFLLGILSSATILGLYSNYYVLISSICWAVQKFFDSFRAVIANIVINENQEKTYKIFDFMNILSYIIGFLCSILFYVFIDFVIKIWIGAEYLLSDYISLAFSFQIFFAIFRTSLWQFIGIKGWFNINKISDLIGIIINLILSILLYFNFGLIGVIIGTISSEIVQYSIELYMIFLKLNKINFNLILKQILLISLYVFAMFLIRINYLFSILVIIIILFYTIYYLKRSIRYVFEIKKNN